MRYIVFIILLICLSCTTQSNTFMDYQEITNIKKNGSDCNKIYKDEHGKMLNGRFRIKNTDNFYKYAEFKNGYYINDVFYIRNKNKIWYIEKYDFDGKIIKYTHYQGKLNSDIINDKSDLYAMEKYDSVSTYLKNELPFESIFYYKHKKNIILYEYLPAKLYLKSSFNGIKIDPSGSSFNRIFNFILKKCPQNIFLYDSTQNEYYKNISIIIETPNEKVVRLFRSDGNDEYIEEK